MLVKSLGVVSDPFYQNSSCVLRCHAALHFAMAHNDVGGSHPLWRGWIIQLFLVLSSLIPYHTRPRTYICTCTYVTRKRVRKLIRSQVCLRVRILLPRNTHRKKHMETPDLNNTRMPWSVPKCVPVDVPIGKWNPWVPWLLQYFLLVPYLGSGVGSVISRKRLYTWDTFTLLRVHHGTLREQPGQHRTKKQMATSTCRYVQVI